MFSTSNYLTTAGVALVVLLLMRSLRDRRKHRLPPGPRSLPLIGNVHQLPRGFHERKFQEWGREYGDIVYARLFQTPAIVVNSLQVARDLMEKRSANYSDRPPLTMLTELLGWDSVMTHFPYGDRYRKHRKWLSDSLQSKDVLSGYRPIQSREAILLLLNILEEPEDIWAHVRRFSSAILLEIAYGHRITGAHDEVVTLAEIATDETVRAGSPGSDMLSQLVEFFPILKYYPLWLPGSGFKKKANKIRTHVRKFLDVPYNMVKDRLASGKQVSCFTTAILEDLICKNSLTEADEDDVKGAAGILYAAGTDTSIAVEATFVLLMVLNPQVYKKAQAEIDRVIGHDRLPDLDDKDSLPYLFCVYLEILRWGAHVPLAIPHSSMNNDVYQGYDIPARTMVLPNVWAMLHNPETYPEPEQFRPERFENLDKAQLDAVDPRHSAFGFGRRMCPGQQLAEGTIYLLMANIIATMDITPIRDEAGNELLPPAEMESGFVLHPRPFDCHIRPRSEKAARLIRHMSACS